MMIRPLLLALSTLLVAATPLSPAQRFGELFRAVQMQRVFPDSKTFADAQPRRSDAAIMKAYRQCACKDRAALEAFVQANFTLPITPTVPPPSAKLSLTAHIDALWPQLTRTLPSVAPGSSALPSRASRQVRRRCRCRSASSSPAAAFAKCTIGTAGSRCWACRPPDGRIWSKT